MYNKIDSFAYLSATRTLSQLRDNDFKLNLIKGYAERMQYDIKKYMPEEELAKRIIDTILSYIND